MGANNTFYVVAKRLLDVFSSALALLFLVPLLLPIAMLIKMTSRGPIFYRQERVGKDGKRFTFLKFRTTYTAVGEREIKVYLGKVVGKDSGTEGEKDTVEIGDDPRVTPIGKILRATSLDELPQFINVLKGEMSLVGPRPPIPYETAHYDEWHFERLKCKPGITGMWQVHGSSTTTFDDMVRLDIEYIRRQSLLLDLKILLLTPIAVLRGGG